MQDGGGIFVVRSVLMLQATLLKDNAAPLGANLQLLSGATSDGEEASKASARQAPSSASRNLNRWNHLQDDHL